MQKRQKVTLSDMMDAIPGLIRNDLIRRLNVFNKISDIYPSRI